MCISTLGRILPNFLCHMLLAHLGFGLLLGLSLAKAATSFPPTNQKKKGEIEEKPRGKTLQGAECSALHPPYLPSQPPQSQDQINPLLGPRQINSGPVKTYPTPATQALPLAGRDGGGEGEGGR